MAIINDSLSSKLTTITTQTTTTTTTLLADAINKSLLQCDHKNIFSFTHNELVIHKIVISSLCIIFGICFIMAGYRFLKISTFFTGFSIGTLIIYFILNEQKVLTISENLIISLSIGILFALVSLLVQYIGIFLLGVTCSSIFVCCILVLVDLFHTNKSIWLCILLLFFGAIIIASLTLKFQKFFSILNTSCIGAALFTSGLDYFLEYDSLLNYIYDLLKVNNYESKYNDNSYYRYNLNDYDQPTTTTTTTTVFNNLINSNSTKLTFHQSLQLIAHSIINSKLCWYTWIVFTGFFLLLIIGILIQCLFTGKNYSHKDSWHHILKNRYRTKSANLEKIRRKSNFKTAINSNNTDDETRIINSNSNNNIATNFNSLNTNANNQNTNSATTTSSFIYNNEETINSNNENTKSTAKLISLNYKPSSKPSSPTSAIPSSPLLNTKSSRNNSQNKQLLLNKDTNAKFRYLYQIRRVNGDVLSKDFLNNFNNKQNNNTNNTANNDNNNNNNDKQTNSNSGSSPQSTASSSTKSTSSSSSSKKSKRNNSNNIDSSTATTLTRII